MPPSLPQTFRPAYRLLRADCVLYTAFLNPVVDRKVELGGRVKACLSLLSFPFTFYFRLLDP